MINHIMWKMMKGKWIILEHNKYGTKVKCSYCGAEVYCAGKECPRCGIKMKQREERR